MSAITGCSVESENSALCASLQPTTWRANSMTAICMPRQMPRYGTSCSRAYCAARIMPSMPRSPKPPGTSTPPQPPSTSPTFSAISVSESTHSICTCASHAVPAWNSDSATLRYASCRPVYLPTRAIFTDLCTPWIFSTSARHSAMSGSPAPRPSLRQATRQSPSFSSSSGTS